jgi:hypothetical protein
MGMESPNDPRLSEIGETYAREERERQEREKVRLEEYSNKLKSQTEEENKKWIEEHPLKQERTPEGFIEINTEEQVRKRDNLREKQTDTTESTRYSSMGFDELAADPVSGPVLQQKALEYLKTQDKDFFEREYTGELDSDGYMIPKNGELATIKPGMSITGKGMQWVADRVKEELNQ